MNNRAAAADPVTPFSIAYAAMNARKPDGSTRYNFSIAYAAMNVSLSIKQRASCFSIAYAAMNSRILAEC